MAVPNSSRPPTSAKAVVTTIEEPDEDEDSDEEDALQLDLAGLSAPEVGEEKQAFAAESGTEAADGGARASDEGDARQVVASISTLALHLQRAKPHEWNELIQVVLQGVMLARGATAPRGRGTGGCASGPLRQEAADASATWAGQPRSAAATGLRVAVAARC